MGGSYLSRPVTITDSEIKSNDKLAYGASSMQGWRVRQEDAHNCILDYDADTAFFAVYDGHGGSEVAIHASKEFPNFLKNTEKYKNGSYQEALIEAFLGFDDTIPSEEVLDKLKELRDKEFVDSKADKEEKRRTRLHCSSDSVDGEDDEDESEEDDEFESAEVLRREASRPIEEVVATYREGSSLCGLDGAGSSSSAGCSSSFLGESSSSFAESGAGSSSTRSSSAGSSSAACSSSAASSTVDVGSNRSSSSSSSDAATVKGSTKNENLTNGSVSEEPMMNGVLSNGDIGGELEEEKLPKRIPKEPVTTTSDQPSTSPKKKKLALSDLDDSTVVKNFIANDEISESDEDDSEDETFELSNNDLNNDDEVDEDDDDDDEVEDEDQSYFPNRKSLVEQLTRHLRRNHGIIVEDSDDSEEDDEDEDADGEEDDEKAENETKSGDEQDEDNEDEEEGEGEEDEEVDAEEDSEIDDDSSIDFFTDSGEQPGVDSGCTAVVALIKGDDLFVANAGDSRCVICKNGVAIDMSEDHKPEDELECARVEKAGGKVAGGRVDGGLNLSRAIGDHRYKKNTELPNTEQMITALPDIRVAKLEPDVEFIILACDGIWNSMTSQEVVDFVKSRIKSEKPLSEICEELFRECLAPNTMCDGTGCDNMTCIIITPLQAGVSSSNETSSKVENQSQVPMNVNKDSLTHKDRSTVTTNHTDDDSPSQTSPAEKPATDVSAEEMTSCKRLKRPNDLNDAADGTTKKRSKTEDVTVDNSSCANSSV